MALKSADCCPRPSAPAPPSAVAEAGGLSLPPSLPGSAPPTGLAGTTRERDAATSAAKAAVPDVLEKRGSVGSRLKSADVSRAEKRGSERFTWTGRVTQHVRTGTGRMHTMHQSQGRAKGMQRCPVQEAGARLAINSSGVGVMGLSSPAGPGVKAAAHLEPWGRLSAASIFVITAAPSSPLRFHLRTPQSHDERHPAHCQLPTRMRHGYNGEQ